MASYERYFAGKLEDYELPQARSTGPWRSCRRSERRSTPAPRDLLEELREGRHAAPAGPVVVLVRGVVAVSGSDKPMKTIGHFRICSIERTAPIVPPSRTNTGPSEGELQGSPGPPRPTAAREALVGRGGGATLDPDVRFFFFTNAFTSLTTFSPFMSGTRRTEALSSARGGTIVFTPGPCTRHEPCTSKVGIAQIRFITSSGSFARIDLKPCPS